MMHSSVVIRKVGSGKFMIQKKLVEIGDPGARNDMLGYFAQASLDECVDGTWPPEVIKLIQSQTRSRVSGSAEGISRNKPIKSLELEFERSCITSDPGLTFIYIIEA